MVSEAREQRSSVVLAPGLSQGGDRAVEQGHSVQDLLEFQVHARAWAISSSPVGWWPEALVPCDL